jgi:hypothetical protein
MMEMKIFAELLQSIIMAAPAGLSVRTHTHTHTHTHHAHT